LKLKIRENLEYRMAESSSTGSNILKLVTVIRKYRPKILLIPHSVERHPDHGAHSPSCPRGLRYYSGLRRIVDEAEGCTARGMASAPLLSVYAVHEFVPSFIVDVSDAYDLRVAASSHRSQFFDPNSKDPQTILSQESFSVS